MFRVAEHFFDSDLGLQRTGNEDSYFARSPLFAVADGMGGAQAGEVASRMAVEALDPGLPDGEPGEGLRHVISEANRHIHQMSQDDERRAGMGTTITAAYVGEQDVTVAHVGDSRAYLLREEKLSRLTRDHSLVGELVARGKLTEEQAEHHPQRSVITRALGPDAEVEVDLDAHPARDGDVFLLCSDGLTSMVPEGRLLPILAESDSLAEAGRQLITAANQAGGRDNITVILFRVENVEPARPARGLSEQPTQPSRDAVATEEVVTAVHEAEAAEGRGDEGAVAVAEVPVRPAPPESSSSSPPRRRRRIPPGLLFSLILLVPVLLGLFLAIRSVYFVGTDRIDGRTITVFRGLPYEGPLGLRLYSRYGGSGVTLDAIPPNRRAAFTDHRLLPRDEAVKLVDDAELGRVEP